MLLLVALFLLAATVAGSGSGEMRATKAGLRLRILNEEARAQAEVSETETRRILAQNGMSPQEVDELVEGMPVAETHVTIERFVEFEDGSRVVTGDDEGNEGLRVPLRDASVEDVLEAVAFSERLSDPDERWERLVLRLRKSGQTMAASELDALPHTIEFVE